MQLRQLGADDKCFSSAATAEAVHKSGVGACFGHHPKTGLLSTGHAGSLCSFHVDQANLLPYVCRVGPSWALLPVCCWPPGDDGADALAAAVASSNSLKKLNLSGNPISSAQMDVVQHVLKTREYKL